jgi:hypothetical protein
MNCNQGMVVAKGPQAYIGPSIADVVDPPVLIHEEVSLVATICSFAKHASR